MQHQANRAILVTSFWQQFSHSKRLFLVKTNYTRKILHLLGMRWAKNFAIIFDGFDTPKKRFRLVSDFFRAQLYLTKFSPRDLKLGTLEAKWVVWYNKVALRSFSIRSTGAEIFWSDPNKKIWTVHTFNLSFCHNWWLICTRLRSTSSFAIKKAGTTYELLIGIFYSSKSQQNFTRNKMGNFQGDLLKCLNISWNDPETCAKALFDGKMAEIMGKHPKAVQNPSKTWWILGQQVRISPKMAPYIKTPSFLPYYSQNSLPKYSSMSQHSRVHHIYIETELRFPEKIKQKKHFFSLRFATWPPFLNHRLLINGSFSRIVTFHMVNVKRVVLWLLFRPYGCILHPRFIMCRQSHTGFFYCKFLLQLWRTPYMKVLFDVFRKRAHCRDVKILRIAAWISNCILYLW